MSHATLCIFAKAPVARKVKTRLIPLVSAEIAARLAAAFLADVAAVCQRVQGCQTVIATPGKWPEEIGRPNDLPTWDQGPGDLGKRMETILARALVASPKAIAIGGDVPVLTKEIIDSAIKLLDQYDAVIGPSDDGGFYLLGVNRMSGGLLENITWSAQSTREQTVRRLETFGYTHAATEPLFDVDRPEDLKRLGKVPGAPVTRALMEELSLKL